VEKIDLPVKKIEQFIILGHHFIRLFPDSINVLEEGFYDWLYKGKINVFVKRNKKLREERVGNEIYNVVDESNIFYIQKDGKYQVVKNPAYTNGATV